MGHLTVLMAAAIVVGNSLSIVEAVEGSPNISVYDKVPGLSSSPYYSFKVREYGSEEWLDTFALLTTAITM